MLLILRQKLYLGCSWKNKIKIKKFFEKCWVKPENLIYKTKKRKFPKKKQKKGGIYG